MTDKKRHLFVTTALPYANGPFHIGHIMEYIQADIWVRHERMCGNTVHFVGADDAHGAPIMIAAQKKGVTPQQFVAEIAAGRKEYLDNFFIKFDHWHCTDSPENTELSQDIYRRLKAAGLIYTKDIEQFYDTEKGMFLADRYIKGTCPKCGAKDQYGDSCEVCGSVYSPTDLVDPKSALSGTTPVIKSSTHYFFKLSDPRAVEFLREWTTGNGADGKPRVQAEVLAKDEEWLGTESGLADWDISRDAPYFGIEIPDAPGKYFYVWLDAPVGYLASFKAYCKKADLDFTQELENPATEQIHFIGKDIMEEPLEQYDKLLSPAVHFDFKNITFSFLPHQVKDMDALVKNLESSAPEIIGVAPYEQCKQFIEALARYQKFSDIRNVGAAIHSMIESVTEKMDEVGFKDDEEWTYLTKIFGSNAIPAESAATITKAIKKAEKDGAITSKNRWQLIEMLATEYLAGK